MGVTFPGLYVIADRETLDARDVSLSAFAEEMRHAGVRLLQYRDKRNGPQEVLRAAREIANVFRGVEATLILNDRADLASLLGWGVHVGQGDLPVAAVRRVSGSGAVVGLSTHSEEQVSSAFYEAVDYLAIGPVFSTSTKRDAEPVVGLEGVRCARALTTQPLVAIGGITRANAASVFEAGADAVAVVGGLFVAGVRPRTVARDLLDLASKLRRTGAHREKER